MFEEHRCHNSQDRIPYYLLYLALVDSCYMVANYIPPVMVAHLNIAVLEGEEHLLDKLQEDLKCHKQSNFAKLQNSIKARIKKSPVI